MGQSKVSMVVPCYNKEMYIGNMLLSVYNQIWNNIELILVNDGSTDGTREIIAEWEPKLRERGFEVTVIDQENQGVAMAVKNGLLRVTGDYVCAPDCDDELYPDYASAMAEYLEARPELEWCFCDFDIYYAEQGVIKKPEERIYESGEPISLTLEGYVLDEYHRVVWRFFMRRRCLAGLKIAENIPQTEQRITHEAYIGMPLIAAGGYGHVEKALYKYYMEIQAITNPADPGKKAYYYSAYYEAISYTLARLGISEDERRRTLALAKLRRDYDLMSVALNGMKDTAEARRAAGNLENSINEFFSEYKGAALLNPGDLERTLVDARVPVDALWGALRYAIGVKKSLEDDVSRFSGKRVIAYGALGKAAASRVPRLMCTAFKPSLLWDKNAKPGDKLCGLPILTPKLDSLSESDLLLVFPKSETAISEVRALLRGSDATVLYYDDIRRHGGLLFFPELCSLTKAGIGTQSPWIG